VIKTSFKPRLNVKTLIRG
ncbi:hypothetical protein Zm00014a_041606, partial [Zea mays]